MVTGYMMIVRLLLYVYCNIFLCVVGVNVAFVHHAQQSRYAVVSYAGEWISGAVCQGLIEFLVNPPTRRNALVSVALHGFFYLHDTSVCRMEGA